MTFLANLLSALGGSPSANVSMGSEMMGPTPSGAPIGTAPPRGAPVIDLPSLLSGMFSKPPGALPQPIFDEVNGSQPVSAGGPAVSPEGLGDAPPTSIANTIRNLVSASPASAGQPSDYVKTTPAASGPIVSPEGLVNQPTPAAPVAAPSAAARPFGGVPIVTGMRADGALSTPAQVSPSAGPPVASRPSPTNPDALFQGLWGPVTKKDLQQVLMAALAGGGNVRPGSSKWGAIAQGAAGAAKYMTDAERAAAKDRTAADERDWKRSQDVAREGRENRRIDIAEQQAKTREDIAKITKIKNLQSIITDQLKNSPEYVNAKNARERLEVIAKVTNAAMAGTSASAQDRKQFMDETRARLEISEGRDSAKYRMGPGEVLYPRRGKSGDGTQDDPIRTLDKKMIPKGAYYYNPSNGEILQMK